MLSSAILLLLFLPILVFAESQATKNLKTVGQEGGDNAPYVETTDISLAGVVSIVIQAFLGLLGVIFISYMLFAGYGWMTAGGDEEKVNKAKDTIQRAIIGLIITIGAYAITFFVMQNLFAKVIK